MSAATAAFDGLAPNYDDAFSHSLLGGHMRRAVQRRLTALFTAGDRVLELGCGTGEDALYLARQGVEVVAVDASPAMVEQARRKVDGAGLGERVRVECLAIEHLERLDAAPFDGVVSSFGPLNCVAELGAVAADLAPRVRPGGRLLLGIMGPLVPWEWLWFLARGRPARAFRRLHPGGTEWRGLRVRYPGVGQARRAFLPCFDDRGARAIGALLPPTYAEAWARRHPRLVQRLADWEQRLERWPTMVWLADHYLLELERR